MTEPHRILIVDDEPGLRVSLAANLELEGYIVHQAENGARAIEIVRDLPIDLVISDVRMPGMNGVEAFRGMRKLQPDLAVVMMTGFTLEALLDEALGEGVFAVVMKPFSMDQILELVSCALARRLVLVVDDSVEHAAGLVAALRCFGLRAEATNDGASAVAIVGREKIDVCVLDLVMPGMDGVSTFEALLEVDPSITVVAISGHPVPDMMHRLMRMGGYACLRKPFDPSELARTIARSRVERGANERRSRA